MDASKNVVKYGVPFPTKQQRKELAKKKDFEDDDSDAKVGWYLYCRALCNYLFLLFVEFY